MCESALHFLPFVATVIVADRGILDPARRVDEESAIGHGALLLFDAIRHDDVDFGQHSWEWPTGSRTTAPTPKIIRQNQLVVVVAYLQTKNDVVDHLRPGQVQVGCVESIRRAVGLEKAFFLSVFKQNLLILY